MLLTAMIMLEYMPQVWNKKYKKSVHLECKCWKDSPPIWQIVQVTNEIQCNENVGKDDHKSGMMFRYK